MISQMGGLCDTTRLYGHKLPDNEPDAIKRVYGTKAVKDYSDEYFAIYPNAEHSC